MQGGGGGDAHLLYNAYKLFLRLPYKILKYNDKEHDCFHLFSSCKGV